MQIFAGLLTNYCEIYCHAKRAISMRTASPYSSATQKNSSWIFRNNTLKIDDGFITCDSCACIRVCVFFCCIFILFRKSRWWWFMWTVSRNVFDLNNCSRIWRHKSFAILLVGFSDAFFCHFSWQFMRAFVI